MPTPYEISIIDIDKYYNNDRGRILKYIQRECVSVRDKEEKLTYISTGYTLTDLNAQTKQ